VLNLPAENMSEVVSFPRPHGKLFRDPPRPSP